MRYGGICFHFKYDTNSNSLKFSNYPLQSQYEMNIFELCGNDAHYGYDCPPQVLFVYNQNPCFDQNFDNNFPLTSPKFSQQNLVCENYGQFVNHQPQEIPEGIPFIESKEWIETKNELYKLMEAYTKRMNQKSQEKEEPPQNFDFRQLIREMCGIKASVEQKQKLEEMMLELLDLCREKESLQNFTIIHEKSTISLNNTSQISLVIVNTPDLPTKEPEYSLSLRDEHLSTILETESDEVIKSGVKNLVPIPSESETNPLFDDEEIISTKIDSLYFNAKYNLLESLLNRDTLIDYSPKFDYLLEEFSGELAHIDPIPPGIEEADFDLEEEIRLVENLSYDNSSPRPPIKLNAEIADTILESLSPSPILVEDSDSHMEEIDLFLATDDLMPLGIEKDDYDSEGDIHFLEELLSSDPLSLPKNDSSNFDHHDDPSFPHPPLKPQDVEVLFDFEPDTDVLTTKVVKGISKHYVLMHNIFPTLPTLDPDLDFTPSHDTLVSGNKIFDLGIFIKFQSERHLSREEFSISFIRDPLYPVFDTLLLFSSKNKDKVFGILSCLLVSHRDKITFDFSENAMMMYGGDIPLLDVPYLYIYPPSPSSSMGDRVRHKTQLTKISASWEATHAYPFFSFLLSNNKIVLDLEAFRARGFVHLPLKFQSLAYGNPIS
nr:hypothetical protein [Tanacetum cinerariifolium]